MIDLGKNLEAGGRINLSKNDDGSAILSKIFFGANWGAISRGKGFLGFGSSKEAVDLDASIVMLDSDKRKVETVYFGHKNSNDGAIHHSGDDLTGDTDGDDGQDNEVISIDLARVSPRVDHLVFILNSYSHQQFDEIPYIGMRIYTTKNGRPATSTHDDGTILAKYRVVNKEDPSFVGKEGMILGEAYRKDGEWKFKAIGLTTHDRSINEIEHRLASIL